MVALHQTREAATLADPDHVHLVLGLKLINQDFVAGLQVTRPAVETELADKLRAFDSGLLQVPRGRLVDPRRLDELEQAKLHRVIAVGSRRLALHHHARTRLEQSHRNHLPVRPEDLRHPDLFSKNSWTHKKSYL